ncbi:MAG: cell wall hydrolase [Sphingomonas bacterium]|uniref:cell wall hydrolase n=1 Tax=Sphingomonas bacterium TaxID=1895847 RepID=UPI002619CA51|nr:cell wall hydrolase [Sphingomonas bacterium]MDB5696873.1 cell wall hydrolase [Sphingomonas bacterium]
MRLPDHPLLRGALVAVLATLGVTGAMATNSAWQAVADHTPVVQTVPAAVAYDTADHFPGAALLYLEDAPAPALGQSQPGVTGSVELPPLPVPIATALAMTAAEQGVTPARPFMMAAASGVDRARAMQCLTDAIYYEAASESDDGQRAVAQVILNRARHPAFPATVCGVIYQGSGGRVCQFSYACDGAMARVPSRTGWARAARHAAAALGGYVHAPVGLATHYHTYAVTPSWNRTLVMTDVIGAHFFHRWKGYWGTQGAFTQRYPGGEPFPGPLAKIAPPMMAATDAVVPLSIPVVSTTATAMIQPAYRQVSVAAPAAAADDKLPPASQVLDKWKDSGKPL